MLVRLEVAHQKANVKKVVLKSDTVIGRSADCNLRIASNEISRRHCQITVTETEVFVRDLGSSNGTFVDGDRIEPNVDTLVAPQGELSLGSVRFRVQYTPPVAVVDPGSTIELPQVTANLLAAEAEADLDQEESPPVTSIPRRPAAMRDTVQLDTVQLGAEEFDGLDPGESVFSPEINDAETVQTIGMDTTFPESTPDSPTGEQSIETLNDQPNAAAEDTIDMRAAEFFQAAEDAPSTPVVDDSPPATDEVQDAPHDKDAPGKRWSLFGMFKRKRGEQPAESDLGPDDDIELEEVSAPDDAEISDATIVEAVAEPDVAVPTPHQVAIQPSVAAENACVTPADSGDGDLDDDQTINDFLSNL